VSALIAPPPPAQIYLWDLDSQKILCTLADSSSEMTDTETGRAPILALEYNPQTHEILCNGGEHDIIRYTLATPSSA
jgi:hypothetical protein